MSLHPKKRGNNGHSGKRKKKVRVALAAPKTGELKVRSTMSCGKPKFANTTREGVQYTRRSNRRARSSGFSTAVGMAEFLMAQYEYAKKWKQQKGS